jgi:hypothetical protein
MAKKKDTAEAAVPTSGEDVGVQSTPLTKGDGASATDGTIYFQTSEAVSTGRVISLSDTMNDFNRTQIRNETAVHVFCAMVSSRVVKDVDEVAKVAWQYAGALANAMPIPAEKETRPVPASEPESVTPDEPVVDSI